MAITKVKGSVVGNVLDNISALLSAAKSSEYEVLGYHTIGDGGGGTFFWASAQDKATHNGGTIIDPDVTFPSDWTNQTQVTAWFTATGVTNGCWVRAVGTELNAKWFGANDADADVLSFNSLINYINTIGAVPRANYSMINISVPAGTYNLKSGSLDPILVSNVSIKCEKAALFKVLNGDVWTLGSSSVFIDNFWIYGGYCVTDTSDTISYPVAWVNLLNGARVFIDQLQFYRVPHILKANVVSGGIISSIYIRHFSGLGHPEYDLVDINTENAAGGAGLYLQNMQAYPYAPPTNPVILPKAITGASNTNPVQLTVPSHGLSTGDRVGISKVVGMTEINDNRYSITIINSNTISLDGIDGSAFGAYSSGGYVAELLWSEQYNKGIVRIVGHWDTAKIQNCLFQHYDWLWRLKATGVISFIFSEDVTFDYVGEGVHELELAGTGGGAITQVKTTGGWTFSLNGSFLKTIVSGTGSITSYSVEDHDIGLLGGHFIDDSAGKIIELNVNNVRITSIGRVLTDASIVKTNSVSTSAALSGLVCYNPESSYGVGANSSLRASTGISLLSSQRYMVSNCRMNCINQNYSLPKATVMGGGARMIRGNVVRSGALPEYVTTSSVSMPASAVETFNYTGLIANVNLRGGAMTQVTKNGTVILTGPGPFSFDVNPGESWSCSYSSAPVLVYSYRD